MAILEEQELSANDLSKLLHADLGVVSYHVRTLRELGLIDLVREEKVRGATRRVYRRHERRALPVDEWKTTPPADKQATLTAALQQIHEYASNAAGAGGFDEPEAHITRSTLKLDEEGRQKAAELMLDTLRSMAELELESQTRSGEEVTAVDVGLVMMLFEATPFSSNDAVMNRQDVVNHELTSGRSPRRNGHN